MASCKPLAIKDMIEIYNIESLDELSVYLSKQEQEKARNWLFSQFDKLYHYANIKEWNELVRICEALKLLDGEIENLWKRKLNAG